MTTSPLENQICALRLGADFYVAGSDQRWKLLEGSIFIQKSHTTGRHRRSGWNVLYQERPRIWRFGNVHTELRRSEIYTNLDNVRLATAEEIKKIALRRDIQNLKTIPMFNTQ